MQSSPYQLLNYINDMADNKISTENFGNAMSARRDMFGNVYPKPQGFFLGTISSSVCLDNLSIIFKLVIE